MSYRSLFLSSTLALMMNSCAQAAEPGGVSASQDLQAALNDASEAEPQLADRNEVSGDRSGHEVDDIDYERYDENTAQFNQFLETLRPFAQSPAPPQTIEKVDDFYISRAGIMFHEECVEEDFDFFEAGGNPIQDFEQMLTDAAVRGLTCMSRGDSYYRERMDGNVTSAYNLMPRFLNLLNDRRPADQNPKVDFRREDGSRFTRDLNCENYMSMFPEANQFPIYRDCEIIRDIPNLPKIFCGQDNWDKMNDTHRDSSDQFDSAGARATLPNSARPIIKNFKGKTKIYTGPGIFLNTDAMRSRLSGQIQSTVFHELFHNLGYQHENRDDEGNLMHKGHNDYAYACQAACFYSEFEERMGNIGIGEMNAAKLCFSNQYDEDSYSQASNFLDAIARSYLD